MARAIREDLLSRDQMTMFGPRENITKAQAVERVIDAAIEEGAGGGAGGGRAEAEPARAAQLRGVLATTIKKTNLAEAEGEEALVFPGTPSRPGGPSAARPNRPEERKP